MRTDERKQSERRRFRNCGGATILPPYKNFHGETGFSPLHKKDVPAKSITGTLSEEKRHSCRLVLIAF